MVHHLPKPAFHPACIAFSPLEPCFKALQTGSSPANPARPGFLTLYFPGTRHPTLVTVTTRHKMLRPQP